MNVRNVFEKLNERDRNEIKERWVNTRASCDYWLQNTISEFVKRKEKALIIGAGSCLDFELKTIAETFQSVDIIDIDSDSVYEAIKELPTELIPKVNIYSGDITGIVEDKIPFLKDVFQKENFSTFIKECEKFRDGLPKTFKPNIPITLNDSYDFVFSNSITTQLFGPAFKLGIFEDDKAFEILNANKKEVLDFEISTAIRVIPSYLRMIHKALKKGGVLAISSDTIEINDNNRKYINSNFGSLNYISTSYLTNGELMKELNSKYLIAGSIVHVVQAIKKKDIKLANNKYLVSWPWDFNEKVQYITVGCSYTK